MWIKLFCYADPIDCSDCHLAWLIRYNRNLMQAVKSGYCSNGTRFESLDPNGFADCPVIIQFIGYCCLIFIFIDVCFYYAAIHLSIGLRRYLRRFFKLLQLLHLQRKRRLSLRNWSLEFLIPTFLQHITD